MKVGIECFAWLKKVYYKFNISSFYILQLAELLPPYSQNTKKILRGKRMRIATYYIYIGT